jgi:hypothetical protein
MLEIRDGPFEDNTPIFVKEDDPFTVRFHVVPTLCLPVERAIPIRNSRVWNRFSWTAGSSQSETTWAARFRGSLVSIPDDDGAFLESILREQDSPAGTNFPVDPEEYERLAIHDVVRRPEGSVTVSVPEPEKEPAVEPQVAKAEGRESIAVQALLAEIGQRMGMQVWIPKADRALVMGTWRPRDGALLERLPLNYDDVTLKTIERIDVLWLKGRSIRRAFEVEHTTSIYSGLLRMADLMALQPNMDIQLHIVAPDERREKVLEEISRPVFTLLERSPLSKLCSYLSYSSIRELGSKPDLDYLSDAILEQFEETAD